MTTVFNGADGFARQRTRSGTGPIRLQTDLELRYREAAPALAQYGFTIDEYQGRLLTEKETLVVDRTTYLQATRGRATKLTPAGIETEYQAPDTLTLAMANDESKHPLLVGLRESLSRVVLIDRDSEQDDDGVRGKSLRQRVAPKNSLLFGHALATVDQTKKLSALAREFVPSIAELTRVVVTGGLPRPRIRDRSGAEFDLNELSTGERQLVLLAAVYVLERPPTLLLLEEPDSGLSGGSLPALRDLLRSLARRTQVVATTHSPLLVELLDTETEVRALVRGESGVRSVPLAEALRSSAWLAGFGTAEAFTRLAGEKKG